MKETREDSLPETKKRRLFLEMMDEMERVYELMEEYDALPHHYGANTLYQAESHLIQYIGKQDGPTISELAKVMKKTRSACSQMIKKLKNKNWVIQRRNEKNNREYNLYLTEEGKQIFKDHEDFDRSCFDRKFEVLNQFTEQDWKTYLNVQRAINETYQEDVEKSHEYFDVKKVQL